MDVFKYVARRTTRPRFFDCAATDKLAEGSFNGYLADIGAVGLDVGFLNDAGFLLKQSSYTCLLRHGVSARFNLGMLLRSVSRTYFRYHNNIK